MDSDAGSLWSPVPVEGGQTVCRQVGPLALWLRHAAKEWHVAVRRTPEADTAYGEPAGETGDLDWARWTAGEGADVVRLLPRLPDRSLVVRPESPIQIPPEHHAVFYVSIPIWVAVAVGEGTPTVLCEEPTVALSNTWFGDPMAGELCYALQTRARRAVDDSEAKPHRAVCPVRIHNAHDEMLAFERLCIRVEHLTLYDGQRQMWTNGLSVRFRGDEQPSLVEYDPGPTAALDVGDVLAEPRVPPSKGLLKRSFASLSSLARGLDF